METQLRRVLLPAMNSPVAAEWSGAIWIGEIELADIPAGGSLALSATQGFPTARLMVRQGREPLGFVEVPIEDGTISASELFERVAALPVPASSASALSVTASTAGAQALSASSPWLDDDPLPTVTVTVSTRDRVHYLREVIPSLLALDYPSYDLLIVDNAPSDATTADYVRGLDDPRIRLVTEPRPGLSYGRNRALIESDADVVAFTDDDVIVDPGWLRAIARGFARSASVDLVTGMVPTGELRTPAQWYFESRTSWVSACAPELYSLHEPRADIAAFPLDVGRYGTGANFAIRRRVGIGLGGFNEALGIGSPARGGEDVDMFVRVLFAGATLAYEPAAIVWHRHRDDVGALRGQMRNYGISWTAWFASLVDNPDTRSTALGVAARHVRRRLRESRDPAPAPATADTGAPTIENMRRTELLALARGPFAYLHARVAGRRTRPLAR